MQLNSLKLKNFRCFNQLTIDLSFPLILIQGENGSGKTSILEALSYLCFLRSFRTHITKELINDSYNEFFIKAELENITGNDNNQIQVGFSGKKRLVKINGQSIQSYKEIMSYFRIVSLIDDDLDLIRGGPESRRTFMDQYIILQNPDYLPTFKKYKLILSNRNALLLKNATKRDDNYFLWTKSMWDYCKEIQKIRIFALQDLENEINNLVLLHFPELKISLKYDSKCYLEDKFDRFFEVNINLFNNEQIYRRSLFGTHLDDFSIIFLNRKTKAFASRGQQKLLLLLIKVAQINILRRTNNEKSLIFLLDDFMTDFDSNKLEIAINLLYSLKIQLIFTSPLIEGPLKRILMEKNAHIIYLNK